MSAETLNTDTRDIGIVILLAALMGALVGAAAIVLVQGDLAGLAPLATAAALTPFLLRARASAQAR